MFMVVYRWRVNPELEERFRQAWRSRTEKIAALRGSHGSRLARATDGTLYAIALWPSREAWAATEPRLPDDEADAAAFAEAIMERFAPVELEVLHDLWSQR